jgi:glutathione S-transferase
MYPFGLIPVLVDGALTLGESSAIMSYLCEKYPHISHFGGRNLLERALVNQYVGWYQGTFR